MNKFGVMIGCVLALGAIPSFATIIDACSGGTVGASSTYSVTTLTSTANQYQCGDKIFSTFLNTGLSGTDTVTITDLTGNNYDLAINVLAGGSVAQAFQFTVAIATGNPTWIISQVQDSMTTLVAVGGASSIPNASTMTVTQAGGPVNLDALTAPDENGIANSAVTTDTIKFSYNPTGTAGQPAGQLIKMDYVISQTNVPEPVTFSLMGIGLLGIGLLKKRLS